jgi:hypothetical protein
MAIRKVELDVAPKPYEVLSVEKTNYRSGKRYAVTVRFSWKIMAVGNKFQAYTETATIPWDKASESLADLKTKGQAAFNALKAADTGEADLIFALQNLTL